MDGFLTCCKDCPEDTPIKKCRECPHIVEMKKLFDNAEPMEDFGDLAHEFIADLLGD